MVSSSLLIKILLGLVRGKYEYKALYTLFKRSRITKKGVIGASEEYTGSKNGLSKVAWFCPPLQFL